ncbi:MAG TPA: prolyl oligopeptidase family serine peptidase [Chloroflexota bacterium]|nr:prolyl oligopeptidase family serine peptidase [Chloroflexota bacterium]
MELAAPYGGWRSPITAASIAAGEVSLGNVDIVGDDVYWLEGKPLEAGRVVVVRRAADGTRQELTPRPLYVRTRVHEYGGGAYLVDGSGTVFFSNFADQRLYRQDAGAEPRPITPEPGTPAGLRYADAQLTPDGRRLVCVREVHTSDGPDATNELVVLDPDGDGSSTARVIATGHDFYSSPRISPEGRRLAWMVWDHPRMPWDGSELCVADLDADGSISNLQTVAGGAHESIFQPEWSPSGELHFVSDRTGWWNLYRLRGETIEPLAAMAAEFGTPQWVFGMSTYAFLADGRIASIVSQEGLDRLVLIAPGMAAQTVDLPYTAYARRLRSSGNTLVFAAASPTESLAVVRFDVDAQRHEVLGRSVEHAPDAKYVSRPRAIAFPTADGAATAFAFYYPPTNADYVGPAGDRPPLIVVSHGGPTAMTQAQLNVELQFWTSRGFGVVDVNYGGSSGFGRAYRERLNGQWGIVDTQDCISAARYLASQGEVDGRRLCIRGGSAGGYTTLCALVFHDDFAAGASYYGVADCEALATDTHKFESRYLDGLIGPYPEARDVYYARSPIHFADRLSCPVILFQGLEDRVVPPSQAERMVEAMRAKDLPFAYLAFAGEQHGFRKAETIQRTLEAELYFYSRVFKFPLAEQIEPVEIENLP